MKKIFAIILCVVMVISCVPFSAGATVKVNSPKMKFVNNMDTTTQKIKWSKVKGAYGYELYCKNDSGKFKKLATLSSNKTKYTNKKLTAGKKYFYKVKAYKYVSGKKIYSKYSSMLGKTCTNYLVDLYSPYNSSTWCYEYKGGDSFKMAGDSYGYGLKMFFGNYYDQYATYNLKGKYKNMTITVGMIDGSIKDKSISIYSDESCVATYEIKGNSLPKTYRIDIENANKLEIRVNSCNDYGEVGIANIRLYK